MKNKSKKTETGVIQEKVRGFKSNNGKKQNKAKQKKPSD